jgi:hypothetical protein
LLRLWQLAERAKGEKGRIEALFPVPNSPRNHFRDGIPVPHGSLAQKLVRRKMREEHKITALSKIQNKIYTIRGKQVMIDGDLAELYGDKKQSSESGSKKKY